MRGAVLALALAASLVPASLTAAPTGATASLTVSPSAARPGQTVHVTVTGAPVNSPPPTVYCLGLYGPGQNGFTGQSPGFRVQIGTISVGANGSGQTDAALPGDLVSGTYQIVAGGCAPHAGLAPLAWFAAGSLKLATGAGATPTSPIPTELPRTGGRPGGGLALAFVFGAGLLLAGVGGRRQTSSRLR